jgi:hypothetical protein
MSIPGSNRDRDADLNPITTSNISQDEVTTSPPGLLEAQSRSFRTQPANVIIATLDVNHSAIGVQGVLDGWERLHNRYTEDLNFRRCLSITERKVIVAKLEQDIACFRRALTMYLSTDIGGGRDLQRGLELNV